MAWRVQLPLVMPASQGALVHIQTALFVQLLTNFPGKAMEWPKCHPAPPHGRPDKDHGFISCWLKGHKMPGSWSFYFLPSWNLLFSLASLTFLFFSLIVFIFISLSLNLFFWKISDLYSVSNPIGFFFLNCYSHVIFLMCGNFSCLTLGIFVANPLWDTLF